VDQNFPGVSIAWYKEVRLLRIENTQQNGQSISAIQNRAELGKDQFMKLLVTQLRFQDPLRPMDDREFISQMAQFSALEQMQNLNREFSNVKAMNMLGNLITAKIEGEGPEPEILKGLVESVAFENGRTNVLVDGRIIAIEDIVGVHMLNPELSREKLQSGE